MAVRRRRAPTPPAPTPPALAPPARAGLGAGAILLLVYAATLAPGVTLWDAGELIAAVHGLGIPHPPGTPLFVLAGRAWTLALAWLPTALAANLMSAAATAAACGLGAAFVARRTGSARAGAAAGLTAGLMSSVWRNATETEVYALVLLLGVATLVAADRAGRSGGTGAAGRTGDARWLALVAYLIALAVPLHLFALVAAPAAILLASTADDGRARRGDAVVLGGATLLAAGVGTARASLVLAGALLLAGASAADPALRRRALATAGATALALTPLLVLLVRSWLDPALDQGNPETWQALADVIARRQYPVAGLWPRQAPLWLQLGNVFEYADWQVALGLDPAPPPSPARTACTLLFAALGALGAVVHRRRDRRSWRALVVLAVAASVGVVLYLNMKAGPSFGVGVLPPGAPREARERDYFLVFAFWTWGLWAGVGAMNVAGRLARGRTWGAPAGLALAALPAALNWSAVDRSRDPDAQLARDAARALLLPLPERAVLLTGGDNDSYPLWYLQQVEGARSDVTVVVVPLLPTAWYRAELASRAALGEAEDGASHVPLEEAVRRVAESAARAGRPLAASALLEAGWREQAGREWVLAGAVWLEASAGGADSGVVRRGAMAVDPARAAAALPLVARQVGDGVHLPPSHDPAARQMRGILSCIALASAAPADEGGTPGDGSARARNGSEGGSDSLLASRCNRR